MVPLSAPQGRVVGSLIEKHLTTPQQYPLTLNALALACNQASNRDPVVAYSEEGVSTALDQLKEQRLVRFVLPTHGRSVVRYRHVLDEVLGVDSSQLAVLAVLLLRGPQTVGELRIRTERMAQFDGLGQVEHELDLLAALEQPLVARLPRRPGQKEERWTELLRDPPASPESVAEQEPSGVARAPEGLERAEQGPLSPGSTSPAPVAGGPGTGEVLATLRADLSRLGEEVATLRAELEELRASLGG